MARRVIAWQCEEMVGGSLAEPKVEMMSRDLALKNKTVYRGQLVDSPRCAGVLLFRQRTNIYTSSESQNI